MPSAAAMDTTPDTASDATSAAAPTGLPVLVTGASRGLGAACARRLAAAGHHVVAVARTQGALEALDDAIQAEGGAATLAPMDVTDDGAMRHLCRGIHDRWGGLRAWVHTAVHAPPQAPAEMVAEKDAAKTWATNVAAFARLIPYVAPLLRAGGGGTFVAFDDDRPLTFAAAYCGSKAAQRAMVGAWRAEAVTPGAPAIHLLTPRPMPTALRARFHPGEDRAKLTPCEDEAARLLPLAGL